MYISFAGLIDLPPKKNCTTALAFIGFKIRDQENKYCDIRGGLKPRMVISAIN